MNDNDLLAGIRDLVEEEHRLRDAHPEGDQERLAAIQVQLDQCWDLLRQRRAAREFGTDPDGASLRPANQVEGYSQ